MKFLLDKPISWRLCRFLREAGHDCLHVDSLGMGQAADRAIYELAAREDCVLITKDVDHFELASRPGKAGRLLWLRCGNVSYQETEKRFRGRLSEIIERFNSGEQIVEIR